jgi:hypothetical protein
MAIINVGQFSPFEKNCWGLFSQGLKRRRIELAFEKKL